MGIWPAHPTWGALRGFWEKAKLLQQRCIKVHNRGTYCKGHKAHLFAGVQKKRPPFFSDSNKRGSNFDGNSLCHVSVTALIDSSFCFFSCRGSGLQDSSLCADYSHSDRHPHNDLHCHWEIPGHCLPAEDEEAVFSKESLQDAGYSTAPLVLWSFWGLSK